MSRAQSLVATLLLLAAPTIEGSASAESPEIERPTAGASEDYVLHCSGCHGAEGEGTSDVVPSFDGLGSLVATPGGREYLARVPGVAQAPLSGARLARLLNWLVERHSGAAPAPLFAAAEVEVLRRSPLRDPLAARRVLEQSMRTP